MRWSSLIAIMSLCLLFQQSEAANVMVNEFYNGSGSVAPGTKMVRDEYIEFVITAPTTAAELAALTFGDSSDNTSQLQGVFQFDQATLQSALASSGLSSFQAGTIIVVKGADLGPQNLTYNPTALNLYDSDAWSIELVAGQGAHDSSETKINGNISLGNNGEVVWIADGTPSKNSDTSGFIHAIGYDDKPGKIADDVIAEFGSENILAATVTTGRSLSNNGGAKESLVATTSTTMGAANSLANSLWIVGGLRTSAVVGGIIPEPGRSSLMMVAIAMVAMRRARTGGACVYA